VLALPSANQLMYTALVPPASVINVSANADDKGNLFG
jgi:hypothetical protein